MVPVCPPRRVDEASNYATSSLSATLATGAGFRSHPHSCNDGATVSSFERVARCVTRFDSVSVRVSWASGAQEPGHTCRRGKLLAVRGGWKHHVLRKAAPWIERVSDGGTLATRASSDEFVQDSVFPRNNRVKWHTGKQDMRAEH